MHCTELYLCIFIDVYLFKNKYINILYKTLITNLYNKILAY